MIWRSPSLSELTPYWLPLGLNHLGSEGSIYITHRETLWRSNILMSLFIIIFMVFFNWIDSLFCTFWPKVFFLCKLKDICRNESINLRRIFFLTAVRTCHFIYNFLGVFPSHFFKVKRFIHKYKSGNVQNDILKLEMNFFLFSKINFCFFFSPGGIPARNVKGERLLLFLGIIDILQSYRLKKKLEHTVKSMIHDGVRIWFFCIYLVWQLDIRF